jgi:hypothetical protein
MKTDKRAIADRPDKTELKAWCHLSPFQAALYPRAVKDLASALEDAEDIGPQGRGAVLSNALQTDLQLSFAVAGR